MSSAPPSASVVSGARWSSIAAGIGTVGDLLRLAFLAAFLPPAEIGLAAFAMLLLQFAIFLQSAGLGVGLVRHEKVDSETFSSVFWFNVVWALALAGIIFALAPLAALTFEMPRLELLIAIGAVIFILSALGQVQRSMMLRDLRYKELAIAEITGGLVGTLATVVAVFIEPTALAMIIGRLVQVGLTTVLLAFLVAKQYKLRFYFSWSIVRQFVSFGAYVTVDRIVEYFGSQADRFFIGVFFDLSILGVYHIAANLTTSMARSFGTALIFRVVYPAMSKMRRDGEDPAKLLIQSQQFILVFMATPLLIGAVLFMLVEQTLPVEWQVAVPLTQYLVFAAIFILFWHPLRAFMMTHNRAQDILVVSFLSNLVMVVGCYLAAQYFDVYAVALVLCAAHVLRTGLMLHWMQRKDLFTVTTEVRWTWIVGAVILGLTLTAQTMLSVNGLTYGSAVAFAVAIMMVAMMVALVSHRHLVVEVIRVAFEPVPWLRRRTSSE